MSERILFYWSKMFVQPFESGMFFSQLRKTISIIIFDEDFLPTPTEKYHSKFHIWEDEERLLFSEALEIHVIELQKAMKFIGQGRPVKEGLLNWLLFLSNDKLEVCEMLSTQSAIFNRAVQEQKVLSQSRQMQTYYDRRLVEIGDEMQRLYDAENRGLRQGVAIGEAKGETIGEARGKLETARKLLDMGLGLDIISKATGLTEAQIRV